MRIGSIYGHLRRNRPANKIKIWVQKRQPGTINKTTSRYYELQNDELEAGNRAVAVEADSPICFRCASALPSAGFMRIFLNGELLILDLRPNNPNYAAL
jgi:hypothetical protein